MIFRKILTAFLNSNLILKCLAAVILSCLLFTEATGQQYLILKKRDQVKAIYKQGDDIIFRIKEEDHFRRQLIVGFDSLALRFHYFDVALDDIAEVERPAEDINYGWSTALIQAGVMYLVADQFNQVVIRDEPLSVSASTFIISSTLVTSGLLWRLLKRKKYNLNKRHYSLQLVRYVP
ncbi:MAG: hypothetical protein R3345_06845 [Fulvivirga sp.]|nr:hypothetical protein [Fulvivirga sp.]